MTYFTVIWHLTTMRRARRRRSNYELNALLCDKNRMSIMSEYYNMPLPALTMWTDSQRSYESPWSRESARYYFRYLYKTNTLMFAILSIIKLAKFHFIRSDITIGQAYLAVVYSSADGHCLQYKSAKNSVISGKTHNAGRIFVLNRVVWRSIKDRWWTFFRNIIGYKVCQMLLQRMRNGIIAPIYLVVALVNQLW